MPSTVVSIRLDDNDARFLKKHRVSPTDAAKQGIQAVIRQIRIQESLDWFAAHPVATPFDAVKAIRESREEIEDRL